MSPVEMLTAFGVICGIVAACFAWAENTVRNRISQFLVSTMIYSILFGGPGDASQKPVWKIIAAMHGQDAPKPVAPKYFPDLVYHETAPQFPDANVVPAPRSGKFE